MDPKDLLTALEFFKDWSNYMLVTTVAALGWVATTPNTRPDSRLRGVAVFCFAISIMFAVFTLALVPLVGEEIANKRTTSIYTSRVSFDLLWFLPSQWFALGLKSVCWPQHVFFLAGIGVYAWWRRNA